jgi:hypothetical protein
MQSELSGPTRPYTTGPVGENRRDHWDGPRAAPRRDCPIDQTAARHPDPAKLGWHAHCTDLCTGTPTTSSTPNWRSATTRGASTSTPSTSARTAGRFGPTRPRTSPCRWTSTSRSWTPPSIASGTATGTRFCFYNGHSTGGLTGSLYADARRDAGTIDAIFLNLPYFDLNASWLAHVDEGDIPPVDLGDAVGQRGEAFLELAPVVIGGPRVSQRLDHLDLHALRGIRLPTLSTKARRPADLQPVGRC